MHELVGRLMRADIHLLDEPLVLYYHDVYDHVLRVAETVDSARDRVGSILDTNLNEQGHQLNEITKKLAAWAAIIAVPTAVTGFYGQNVPYPGFGHWSGFIASAFIILVLAGGLYAALKRSHWLQPAGRGNHNADRICWRPGRSAVSVPGTNGEMVNPDRPPSHQPRAATADHSGSDRHLRTTNSGTKWAWPVRAAGAIAIQRI